MVVEKELKKNLLSLLEKTPLDRVTVSMLAAKTGISRSSFYYYYDSVYEIADEIEEEFIRGLGMENELVVQVFRTSGPEKTKENIHHVLEYVSKNLQMIRVLSGPNGDPSFQEKLHTRLKNISQVIYSVSKLSPAKIEVLTEAAAAEQWYVYKWWANHEDEITLDEMVDIVSDIYLDPLKWIKKK